MTRTNEIINTIIQGHENLSPPCQSLTRVETINDTLHGMLTMFRDKESMKKQKESLKNKSSSKVVTALERISKMSTNVKPEYESDVCSDSDSAPSSDSDGETMGKRKSSDTGYRLKKNL